MKINDVIDEKYKLKDRITIKEKKTGKIKNFPIADTEHVNSMRQIPF